MKTGEIFRNNSGQYSFMCFHCGLIFEDFGEIINHCESHYHDVEYKVSEAALCPETDGTELHHSIFSPPSEATEPMPDESINLAIPSQVSVQRRKKKSKPKMLEATLSPDESTSLASGAQIKRKKKIELDFPQHCPKCGVWCENFRDHVNKEHNFYTRIYQCFMCGHCVTSYQSLRKHMASTAHAKNTCYHCAMEPPVKDPTESRRHKCLFCKEWYENHAEFKIHFKAVHNEDADSFFAKRSNCTIFTCYLCEKEFPLRYYLVAHIKTHYDKFLCHTCPTCGKRLRSFGLLTQHLKTHEGKTFHCDQCDKQFAYYTRLRLHRKCHVTELNYKCDQCPKAFKLQKYLKQHQKVHTQQRKFACRFCGATFNFSTGRRAHEKSQHNAI